MMMSTALLSDADHSSIQAKATSLTAAGESTLEKVERIFHFVRDEIRFGFPPKWDVVKASEVLTYGMGQCNNKATLFVALCRAAGISARVHCGLIDVDIMRGVFPPMAFLFLPKAGSHAWTEVQVEGQWKPIDSYINDRAFYEAARHRLSVSGKPLGYSVAFLEGKSSCEFNSGEKGFAQMGAVVEDHGTWEDFSQYLASNKYSSLDSLQLMLYPMMAKLCNRNIERMRSSRPAARAVDPVLEQV
jgi:hypothetical protein